MHQAQPPSGRWRGLLVTLPWLMLAQPGCQTTEMQAGADLRSTPDLRMSPGNLALGISCQTVEKPCPSDAKTMQPARCASIGDLDLIGACAPSCSPESFTPDPTLPAGRRWMDCDTILPGDVRCTQMSGANKYECVIFCDESKMTGRVCPQGWSCAAVQGYKLCRPPQIVPDMR